MTKNNRSVSPPPAPRTHHPKPSISCFSILSTAWEILYGLIIFVMFVGFMIDCVPRWIANTCELFRSLYCIIIFFVWISNLPIISPILDVVCTITTLLLMIETLYYATTLLQYVCLREDSKPEKMPLSDPKRALVIAIYTAFSWALLAAWCARFGWVGWDSWLFNFVNLMLWGEAVLSAMCWLPGRRPAERRRW